VTVPAVIPSTIVGGVTARHNDLHHGELLYWHNNGGFEGYFAVGTPATSGGAGKDKAAVLAAVNAAIASPRGGTVRFGPGNYDVGDLAISLPNTSADFSISLQGAAHRATLLTFSTDRGAGTKAITSASAGGANFHVIRDLKINGPGGGARTVGLGNTPAAMDGVHLQAGSIMTNCQVQGFKGGVVIGGDHIELNHVNSNNNFDGVYFEGGTPSQGDIILNNCGLDGNLRASIGIANNGIMLSTTIMRGHLGVGPYCIYIEPGSTIYNIQYPRFLATSFESCGNGHIIGGTAGTGSMLDAQFDGCGNWTYASVYKIPSVAVAPADFYLANMNKTMIRGDGPTSINTNTLISLEWFTGWKYAYSRSITNGVPFIVSAGVGLSGQGRVLLVQGDSRAVACQLYPGYTINAGDLVQRDANANYVRPYLPQAANGGSILAGVARNTPTGNTLCIVAVEDYDGETKVNVVGTGYAAGNLLFPDATTKSSANRSGGTGMTGYASQPIVGVVSDPTIAAGQLTANIAVQSRPT